MKTPVSDLATSSSMVEMTSKLESCPKTVNLRVPCANALRTRINTLVGMFRTNWKCLRGQFARCRHFAAKTGWQ